MITQIILAAGLSSRMGSLKPLLDFDGRPLLGRLLDECRRSLVDVVVVVLGHRSEEIFDAVDLGDVNVVINHDYMNGQTSSLQAALRRLHPNTRAFLNLPVDHPLVTSRDIDALVEACRGCADPFTIGAPAYQGRLGRPLLFGRGFRDVILELAPGQPVHSVLERFGSRLRRVSVDNPYTMKDMDTPDEYRECLELYRQMRSAK